MIEKLVARLRFYRRNGDPMLLSQLAKETGINYHTLRKAALDGRLTAAKQGRFWLSTVRDVQRAVDAGEIRG